MVSRYKTKRVFAIASNKKLHLCEDVEQRGNRQNRVIRRHFFDFYIYCIINGLPAKKDRNKYSSLIGQDIPNHNHRGVTSQTENKKSRRMTYL